MKNKTRIAAFSLFALTAGAIVYYPAIARLDTAAPLVQQQQITQQKGDIEVVFVLDTTGSMSGMINAAKEKIWSIASTMAASENANNIRVGLVAYRDRGDEYVTRTVDLSSDLDSMYVKLMGFQANGGGDGPESVNEALHTAVDKLSWGQDKDTYRVVFLVGDAPPHMDYPDDVKYPETLKLAQSKGIIINAIQCGKNRSTKQLWQSIAQLGQGDYLQVEQGGSAIAISTPYDEKLAKLSRKLDQTRIYYGDEKRKAEQKRKLAAAKQLDESSSTGSKARRAEFNVSAGGKANFLGEGELVDDISSSRITLDAIDKDHLPAPMQAMSPDEVKQVIEEKASERAALTEQISELSRQRAEYLKQEMEKTADDAASLDHKIFSTVKEQAESKGIHYKSDAVKY